MPKRRRNTPTPSLKFPGASSTRRAPIRPRIASRCGKLRGAAFRLIPNNTDYLTARGAAQYRTAHYREAVDALDRVDRLTATEPDGSAPDILAFLAARPGTAPGETGQAKARTGPPAGGGAEKPRWAGMVIQPYVHEAELIERDLAFPADPFTQ